MKTPSAFMPAWLPAWLLACLPLRLARRCAKLGVKPCTPTGPTQQLLVDVSVIYRSDARTGIQRVVRALLLQLLKAPPPGYEVRPVFATRQHGYSYAALNLVNYLYFFNIKITWV